MGRREEALAAAEEAAALYRTLAAAEEAAALYRPLAAARPDVFTPGLAMSLSVLGDMLEANDQIDEAVARDHEAVAFLEPYFLSAPKVFGGHMRTYLRDYLRRAQVAGVEVDAELVGPVLEEFKRSGILEDKG